MNAKPSLKLPVTVLATACAILAGCTSVTVQSTKDTAAVHKIGRLFVLINHGDLGNQTYSNELAANLRSVLSNPPPVMEISIASPLELDEKVHVGRIQRFNPEAVLVIRLSTAVLDEFGGYPILKYDASLFDPKMEKRLWRGAVNNSGGTALMKRRMRETAEVIISQLQKDGFL